MARPHVIARLKRFWAAYRKRQQAGFTLIELLVAMFIGGIITVTLLALVVQLVDVNQRDSARSETQRDMQAAMNYISQELREAVFVYDGRCLQGTATITAANYTTECPGLLSYIPPGLSTASTAYTPIPVLAFWRADPLPQGLLAACSNNSGALDDATLPAAVQGVPCLSGRTYTLVVYTLFNDTSTSDIWPGRARLVRYQLAQFASSATSGTQTNTGYVDPLSSPNSSFQQWPFQLTTDAGGGTVVANAQTSAGGRPGDGTLGSNSAVLVDYVDDGLLAVTPVCAANSNITPFNPNPNIRSFYACIRGKTYGAVDTEQGVNQEVQLFLAGNVQGRPGFPLRTDLPSGAIESQAFPLQTRVLTRGIINKSPK
ncbi:MAG: prepilin-type N-terminal cleavage/methylation domain-containing protein [Lyngbya sp. HA4199-MV5]|jgi:prepilin-type N-terminal cleavage/methylation domain-containing protein|nr:prepilin-type N-terminal cleavage/methylation domain-containing protein [Lyngbya sp. HA4199-MV5]